MKKGSIIALIVAFVLILSGGVILVLGLSYAGDDMQSQKLTERTVTIDDDFDFILINTEDCDVSVQLLQPGEKARVEIAEFPQTKHTVTVKDKRLEIELTDHRKWLNRIGIFWEDMKIRLYLPAKEYTDMRIVTATGDIVLPAYLDVYGVTLYSDTGAVRTEAAASSVSVETKTGEIAVCACKPDTLTVKTDTGVVGLCAMEGTGQYYVETDTGKIEIHNVKCRDMICENDTGDVFLWLVQVQENMNITTNTGDVYVGNSNTDILKIETDTGEVEIDGSDAGAVSIETDTGDVSGKFLTSKWFQAHSDTGKVSVPDTREGGECRIESDTGDIHFE